ncbi:MAG: phosphoribosyl-ATP diphosphatase [Merdibacter sp.]
MKNEMQQLYETIVSRKSDAQEFSVLHTCLKKETKDPEEVGEECTEVIIAAMKEDNKEEIVNEIGDLLYHLFVLMAEKGISLADVEEEPPAAAKRPKISNRSEERSNSADRSNGTIQN